MFTGIIEETGTVVMAGSRFKVRCGTVLADSAVGASIAVNGVCLTMAALAADGFEADLSPETLARTSLGVLRPGSLVNLERPMALGERLGGHIVQGHVDATAQVAALQELSGGNWDLRVNFPAELGRYMIHKGSVAVDGVSLTIASIDKHCFSVAIIPHTYENTSMREYEPGTRVNIEVDLIAKYVEKLVVRQ